MSQINTSMNFLPEDYVEKRQAARAAVVFIGLLLVVVGGIVGTYLFNQWHNKSVFETHDQVNAEFENANKQIDDLNKMKEQKARMIAKAENVTTLMERVQRSALLVELKKLHPASVNFMSVELKSKELPPEASAARASSDLEKARRAADGLAPEAATKPPVMEVSIDLTATAPTDSEVASYMSALKNSPLFTDVNLLFSEEFKVGKDDGAQTLRRFHVEMKVNPAADLRTASTVVDGAPLK